MNNNMILWHFVSVLVLVIVFEISSSFSFQTTATTHSYNGSQKLRLPSIFRASASSSSSSGFEGNRRSPSEQEIEIMDLMIEKLANAKPYELPEAVKAAYRVISSPQFFLRLAVLTDQAIDESEKDKLASLSVNIVNTLEAVVSIAEDRIGEREKQVEEVLKAAAEPDSGEFFVPLVPERINAMRLKLEQLDQTNSLDEGFLSTVDLWMNKCHQDGLDGMVIIMQKVVQMWSGTVLSRINQQQQPVSGGEDNSAANSTNNSRGEELFYKLLRVDSDVWDIEIKNCIQEEGLEASELLLVIKNTMDNTVLRLANNGSLAQRTLAAYLNELTTRVETIQNTP